MLQCRRSRRSSVPSLALELLLDAELERSGAQAVAIGTLDGRPRYGSGDLELSRVTAAGAAKLAGFAEHPLLDSFDGVPFGLSVVELAEGERVLLTSVGRSTLSREVESGVARILSQERDEKRRRTTKTQRRRAELATITSRERERLFGVGSKVRGAWSGKPTARPTRLAPKTLRSLLLDSGVARHPVSLMGHVSASPRGRAPASVTAPASIV